MIQKNHIYDVENYV